VNRGLLAGALLAACGFISGCGTSSPDPSGYREEASLSLGTAASEVATTRLFLEELDEADVWSAVLDAQLRYSADGVASAAQSFGDLDPPPGSDRLQKRCSALLDDADSLLAEVRIAVHRGADEKYPALVDDLAELARRMETLERRVSS
jgi:hypothetical protein